MRGVSSAQRIPSPSPIRSSSRLQLGRVRRRAGDLSGLAFIGADGTCFEATPSRSLLGDIDIEAIAATIPEGYAMRGMFFAPLAAHAGADFASLAPRLSSPPRLGRYLPFAFYPTRDFLVLFDAAARRAHPGRGAREAYRLRARSEIEVFRKSQLGLVTAGLVDSPRAALLKYPDVVKILTKGPAASVYCYDDRTVRIEITDHHGILEYTLGAIESLVMFFGQTPTVVVDVYAPDAISFLVSW